MAGKIIAVVLLLVALIFGGTMYYAQVYGYYDRLTAEQAALQLTRIDGAVEPAGDADLQAIDADSSPIRFRACMTLPLSQAAMTEAYALYDGPEPLIAPKWFDCFDAKEIGADLEAGRALAFLSQANVHYGIDRVIAVYDDGRAFAWHQINACGEKVFDGEPAPEGCPPVPERTN